MLLTMNMGVGQSPTIDKQWLILNEGTAYKQNGIYNTVSGPNALIELNQYTHPTNIDVPNTNQFIQGRNDLFIIYDNGSHFNSYSLPNNIDWQISNGLFPDKGYQLVAPTILKIKYLYYTNVYEEDDPEPETRVAPVGSSSLQPLLVDVSVPPQRLTVNHTIVENKDVTVIIKGGDECQQSRLCFSLSDSPQDQSAQIHLEPSQVFTDRGQLHFGYNVGTPVFSDTQQCIDNINVSGDYGYINLKIQDEIEEYLLDREFVFTYSNNNPNCRETITVPITQAHDPNYVKVQCVSTDGKYNYVRYRIHVYNDESTAVDNLELSFVPPNEALTSAIDIADYNIGGVTNIPGIIAECKGILSPSAKLPIVVNTMTSLGPFESAYVDLCIKFPLQFDILREPLIQQKAISHFGKVPYSIVDFYDLPSNCNRPKPTRRLWNSKASTASKSKRKLVNMVKKRRCPRQLSTTSECPCDQSYSPIPQEAPEVKRR